MGRKSKEIIYPHLNDCNGNADGKWYVEFSALNKITGEKVRQRIYEGFDKFKTEKQKRTYADQVIKEYTEKLNSGWRPFENPETEFEDMLSYYNSITFKGKKTRKKSYIQPLFSEYLVWKKPYVAKMTYENHCSKLRQFSQYLESNDMLGKDLSYFNNDVVVGFLRTLAETKARRTIEKYQQIIHGFFSWVQNEKKINIQNPVENIPRMGLVVDMAPAGIPDHIRGQLRIEIEREDPQLWMACCFIYYTAIRPGTELRLLKIKQINFSSRTITVRNELAKNRRTETIDMPDELYSMIADQWELQKYNGDLYVFGKEGRPGPENLGKNSMRVRFNKFRDRLNLPKEIKYYSWKHSGAQELADAGANIYELKRHLRHCELATTEAYLRKRIGQKSKMIKHKFPKIG